ncbi:Protein CBG05427 [Caenorhabditis briggsae]|uniref:Protein CBG05427 n=1 Tax=Caenorhabditis briggsae TaxID=6238 RepID=E3CTX9_CAEBR|nr:Protein CBG05427 [Caenorhabditis briggsae]CBX33022.1 Protein CBG05427 [Caenorhabditis briggsae]
MILAFSLFSFRYLDLVLVHYPRPFTTDDKDERNKIYRKEAWLALESLKKDGKIRSIGISNYEICHIEEMHEYRTIEPTVNQVEFHPHFQRKELREFCQKNGILFQAFSPFGRGNSALLNDQIMTGIAEKHHTTVSSVILTWIVQSGNGVAVKSKSIERVSENFKMSFQVSVAVNDAPLQKITVTPSTTIGDLHSDAILVWKDMAIVYDVTEGNGNGPATTLEQLGVNSLSMIYVYTTSFPCPSGDIRSIVPAQVRLITQFASAASNLFNQAKTTAPSSSSNQNARTSQQADDGDDGSIKTMFSRKVLEKPSMLKALTENMFFRLKNEAHKLAFQLPDLVERFTQNKDQTYSESILCILKFNFVLFSEEFEAFFRSYIEEEVHKEEIIQNNPNSAEAKMFLEARRNKELINEQYVHVSC